MEAGYSFQIWGGQWGMVYQICQRDTWMWYVEEHQEAESFFGQVLYAAGKGFHIRFWHDPWNSPTTLKDLYPAMFAIAANKEVMISDMVDFALVGGGRSQNLRFRRAFQDQEIGIFYDFFAYISSKLPRGGDDTMI